MAQQINFDLNEEQKKEVKTFIEDYKALNWFILQWRIFNQKCYSFKANNIVERIIVPTLKVVDTEYKTLRENFFSKWDLGEEEKAELERIVNSEKTDYWDRYFNHDFDGREEEAMIPFLAFFEYEMEHFFKLK